MDCTLFRVKVAFLILLCFDAPKCLARRGLGRLDKPRKEKARRGECRAARRADVRN